MKIGNMMVTAGVLALGLASWTPSKAQGPMYDRVNVSLPYSVTIGDRTLQPGDYVIQQLRDNGGGSRVLLIYSDNGMKFETSAMTIPALQGNNVTPDKTSVVLHHFGSDYYFDKVWIQGKDYGYEFPLPDAVKSRQNERMQPIAVAASYSTVPQSETTNAATTAATNQQTTLGQASAAQATTTPSTTQSTTTTPSTTQSTTTMQPSTTQSTTTTQPATTTAQNTPEPATTPSTAAATPQTMHDMNSADRSMPNTNAGWLMMLLGGGALSSAGFALRRKR